jgi:CubicO group peptidase (beta-lactamase class C family)
VEALERLIDATAETTGFSGVVRVDRAGGTELCRAYGFADRSYGIANTTATLFATASGTKSLTALVVMSLVERGTLRLDTTARSLLGNDLPLIREDVTIEHLLAHRSGIGDYLNEEAIDDITDYVMPVPVHELATTEQYLPLLDGHEPVFRPGERFAYNNGGYVLLALLAERASGVAFHHLVETRVCQPAGMVDTAFLRSDELPGRAARGYLSADGVRTNIFHLPVVGSGDGGIYSTVADLHSLWEAFVAGRVVTPVLAAEMVRPRSVWPDGSERYGLGFHLHATGDAVWLEGHDAGVSLVSLRQPSSSLTYTVISNSSEGAWPIVKVLGARLRHEDG